MIKIFNITILLLFCTLYTTAQNYIGSSKKYVFEQLHEKGFIINKSKLPESNIEYFITIDGTATKFYLFDDNNVCIKFICAESDITKINMEKALYSNGYIRNSDGAFYSESYKAIIEYSETLNQWTFIIVAK